jgi:O-antigen/teichoic acid export membrane protein
MQKKKFILDLGILLVLNLLIKPFWTIIIEPKVQGQIGDILYGQYFVIFNMTLVFSIFLDLGLTNFNNTNIAQNRHLLSKHFSKMLGLKFALGLFYMILMFVFGYIKGFKMELLLVLSLNMFFLSFILFLRSNLQALHLFMVDSLISVLDRVIMISILVVLLLGAAGAKVNVMNFAYAQTAGYALTAIIAFIVVLNKTHTFKLNWDKTFYRMILKKSLPYAVLVLLMAFYNRFDSYMIVSLLPGDVGNEQSGIYAKGFRLLDAANQIAYLFSVQLLPLFSRMTKQRDNIENVVKLSFTLLLTPALIVSVSTIFYAEHFFDKIYTHETKGYEILAVLMCCFTAISLTYIFGTLLTASGNLKKQNMVACGGIVVNVALNFILIPRYLAFGSAIASLVTQLLTGLLQVYICYKVFKFRVNVRLLVSLFFFIAGLFILNSITIRLFNDRATNDWMYGFVIMLIFSVILAFATGMVNPKSVLRFLKYK